MKWKKRYIQLSEAEELTLRSGVKNHPKSEFRRKCQALLLSHRGLAMRQICEVLEVSQTSLCSWFSQWEAKGICGLQRSKGQGRKPILRVEEAAHQKALVRAQTAHYQDVKSIQSALIKELKLGMSTDTVKRFLKKIITPGAASAATLKRGSKLRNTRTSSKD